jgi:hypothetical protein
LHRVPAKSSILKDAARVARVARVAR